MIGGEPEIGDTLYVLIHRQLSGPWAEFPRGREYSVQNGRVSVDIDGRNQIQSLTSSRFEEWIDSVLVTVRGVSRLPRDGWERPLASSVGGVGVLLLGRDGGSWSPAARESVLVDGGSESTSSDYWGRFHFEGNPGPHTLRFPSRAGMEPVTVQLRPGCRDFVRIRLRD